MINSSSRPILFVPEQTGQLPTRLLPVRNWSSTNSSNHGAVSQSFGHHQSDNNSTAAMLDNLDHSPMLLDDRSWYQSILEDFLTSRCSKAANPADEASSLEMCTFYSIGFIEQKVILVAIFGSLLSFSGVIQNALLFYLYLSREKFRQSNMVFLGLAAIFDVVVDASYIFLMTVSVLYEYYHSLALSRLWHSYVRTINAASQTSMTASSFLLVSATMERYRVSMNWRFKGFAGVTRITIAGVAMSAACILQTITYFELEVHYKPHCENSTEILSAYSMTQSCLAQIPAYTNIFQFWIRKLATICFPFVLLCYFNLAIIIKLRQPQPEETDLHSAMLTIAYGNGNTDEHKLQKNRATRTMVIVATSYLIVHSLNFFLASWEMIDKQTLYHKHFKFYSFAADTCSILAIFGNVIRLPIYLTSDNDIRKEFLALFQCCCSCARLKEPPSDNTMITGDGKEGQQDLIVDEQRKEVRQATAAEEEQRQAAQLSRRLTKTECGERSLQPDADDVDKTPQALESSTNNYNTAVSSLSSDDLDGNHDDITTSTTPLENEADHRRRHEDDMKQHQKLSPTTNNYYHNEETLIMNNKSSPNHHYATTTTTPNSADYQAQEQIHRFSVEAAEFQQEAKHQQEDFGIIKQQQQQQQQNGIIVDQKCSSQHPPPVVACRNDSCSFNHFGPQPFLRNRPQPTKQDPSGGKKSNPIRSRKCSIGKGRQSQKQKGKSAALPLKKPLIPLIPYPTPNSAHYHQSMKHRSFSNNFGYPSHHNNGSGSYDALLMMADDLVLETNNELQPIISLFSPTMIQATEASASAGRSGSEPPPPPIHSSHVTFIMPSQQQRGSENLQQNRAPRTDNQKQPRSWLPNFLSRPSSRKNCREQRVVNDETVQLEFDTGQMTRSKSAKDCGSATTTNQPCSSRRSFPFSFISTSANTPSNGGGVSPLSKTATTTRYHRERKRHQGHSAPRRAQSSANFGERRGSNGGGSFNRYLSGRLNALKHGNSRRKHCNGTNNNNIDSGNNGGGGSANLLDPSTIFFMSDDLDSSCAAQKYFPYGGGWGGAVGGNQQYLNGYLPSHLARKFVNSNYSISDL